MSRTAFAVFGFLTFGLFFQTSHQVAEASPKSEGVLFQSQTGRYSVRFPSQPGTETQQLGTLPDGKPLTIEITMYEAPSGIAYGATITQLQPIPEDRISTMLDEGVRGAVASLPSGVLHSVENTSFNGHPGRTFTMSGSMGGVNLQGKQMLIYKPGVLIQFMAMAPPAQANDPTIDAFFASIQHH